MDYFKLSIYRRKKEHGLYDIERKFFDTEQDAMKECEKIEKRVLRQKRPRIVSLNILHENEKEVRSVYFSYLG